MMEERPEGVKMKAAGAVLLVLSLLISFTFQFAHAGLFSRHYTGLPGIGLTISLYLILGAVLWAAAREGRLHIRGNWAGLLLLGCSLALGACYGVFSNASMRMMNAPVLLFASVQAILSLSGYHEEAPLSAAGWRRGLGGMVLLFFLHLPLPFRALRDHHRAKSGKLKGLGAGLLIGIPVVIIAVWLLSSADSMFDTAFSSGFQWISDLDGAMVFRMVLAFFLGLMLFSFLHGAVTERAIPREKTTGKAPSLTFSVILYGLAAVYGLFAYIQFRYLFSCVEAAQMQGGYAEYARSGFFQLVLLSCITLSVLLSGLSLCRDSRAVRLAGALVAALTIVIDVSAFFRMRLYIEAYGLTVLRVVTLWGMGAILIALLLAIVKCVRPDFKICPWLTGALLITWIGLNFMNVDARIAEYNVSAWEKGQIASLDAEYLGGLSPDVLPALEKIADEEARSQALEEALTVLRYRQPQAYDWSLSWRHMPEKAGKGPYGSNDIERRIIIAADSCLEGEGVCDVDLAAIFTDFEWDTVSIFIGGNSKQVRDALKIDPDISDGIVFSWNGEPIKQDMSTYLFPADIPPDVGYAVERASSDAPYYISLPYENAVVHVKKYAFRGDGYKYQLYREAFPENEKR